jgi:hypothetical protein
MKLRVILGFHATKEVNWWQQLSSFPNLIQFRGINFEWVTYDDDVNKEVDKILTFSALMTYHPNFNVVCPVWEQMFPEGQDSCECGARFTAFPFDHMHFCKKWSPW